MIAKTPTAEQLDALRAAFAKNRPKVARDFDVAARAAKVTAAAARRAWSHGWPDANITPLESEFSSEREALVATVKAEIVAGAALARAFMLGEQLDKLAPAAVRLIELVDDGTKGCPNLDAPAALDMIRALTAAHRAVAVITKSAIELDRLVAGEATSIVQHTSSTAAPVDLEKTKTEAHALLRAIAREEEKARLTEKGEGDGGTVH